MAGASEAPTIGAARGPAVPRRDNSILGWRQNCQQTERASLWPAATSAVHRNPPNGWDSGSLAGATADLSIWQAASLLALQFRNHKRAAC
jgi:hypothetical protein